MCALIFFYLRLPDCLIWIALGMSRYKRERYAKQNTNDMNYEHFHTNVHQTARISTGVHQAVKSKAPDNRK